MTNTVLASLARIADFERVAYDVTSIEMSRWSSGDYIVGRLTHVPVGYRGIEDATGTMVPVNVGDHVLGAIGDRAATLEGVGSWRDVVDGKMHAMTSAGLFGYLISVSTLMPETTSFDYVGHVTRQNAKVCMQDFAITAAAVKFSVPTVLLVGTSMSAGKTLSGKLACKTLAAEGVHVVGSKLTGAGRYRDILGFRQSGAREVADFVDAGMPSTALPETEYREAIRPLLHHIESLGADILVAEAGASPLEPYNGAAALEELGDNVACTILAASDPYAVVGVMDAFGLRPDLVTGPATSTTAAVELVRRLTGLPGINIIDPQRESEFREFLLRKLQPVLPLV